MREAPQAAMIQMRLGGLGGRYRRRKNGAKGPASYCGLAVGWIEQLACFDPLWPIRACEVPQTS